MRAWIVQLGRSTITGLPTKEARPRLGSGRLREIDDPACSGVGFATPLDDPLVVGPHHIDLHVQSLLRRAWWHAVIWDEAGAVEQYGQILSEGGELVLWWNRDLATTLSMLWLIDRLQLEGEGISLVFDPQPKARVNHSAETISNLLERRMPLRKLLAPCLSLRRTLAADTGRLDFDLPGFPEDVRPWADTVGQMVDFLPDERGLDRFDSQLLGALTDKWQSAVMPVAAMVTQDEGCCLGDILLWQRLIELSDLQGAQPGGVGAAVEGALCELRIDGPAAPRYSRVRLTPFGEAVRSGQADALQRRKFCRWVGGRLLTNERMIRCSGSHRRD